MLDFIFYFLSPWIFLMGKNVHIVHACHVETLGLVIFYVYKVMLGPFQLYILFSECGDWLYFKENFDPVGRCSNFIFFLVSVVIDCISKKILILLEDEN